MKSVAVIVAVLALSASSARAQSDNFFQSEDVRRAAPYQAIADQPKAWWDNVFSPAWEKLIVCTADRMDEERARNPKVSFDAAHSKGAEKCRSRMAALQKIFEPVAGAKHAAAFAREGYEKDGIPFLKVLFAEGAKK
jgi:hypothetical protein